MFHLGIHGAEIEAKFAGVFGSEWTSLEFDNNVAAEFKMVEEEINKEIVASNFKLHLSANEGEASSEFNEKMGDVFNEGGFDGALLGLLTESQKIEPIRIFEGLPSKVGLWLRQAEFEVCYGLTFSLQSLGFDMDFENIPRPAMFDRCPGVGKAPLGIFESGEEDNVVAPG
jgi:hypothetical protein